jgi:quercetin dioxygenase-like cupin family protein
MGGESVISTAGEGDSVSLRETEVTYKVSSDQAAGASCLEFAAAPGFDTGLHVHKKLEETFYVLEGEFELQVGEVVRRGPPGTLMFVAPGCPTGSQTRPISPPSCS